MADISFVSLPGVITCAVGGVIRIFAWSLNKEASQVASAKRIDTLSGILVPLAHDSGPCRTNFGLSTVATQVRNWEAMLSVQT